MSLFASIFEVRKWSASFWVALIVFVVDFLHGWPLYPIEAYRMNCQQLEPLLRTELNEPLGAHLVHY